jgi:hypothetical protein
MADADSGPEEQAKEAEPLVERPKKKQKTANK